MSDGGAKIRFPEQADIESCYLSSRATISTWAA